MSSLHVQNTLNQINKTLKGSSQGPYSSYSCKTVSWDDVQRGTVGGSLSCWGSNITDTRLWAKDGRQLFTVRSDNWNERLGKVSSSDLALVASENSDSSNLRPHTLREILSRSSEFGEYVGLKTRDLTDEILDKDVSVRFQTTFLPVEEGEKTAMEFAPEAYNYNTTSDDDPRNLILLCTTQGLAIQQDGAGAKKLYHHAVDENGTVSRYWLEAESSNHKVGGSQVESLEEKEDAIKRGKATSSVIGVKGIGTRFNVLMTIQVPLKQKPKPEVRAGGGGFSFGSSSYVAFGSPPSAATNNPFLTTNTMTFSGASSIPFGSPSTAAVATGIVCGSSDGWEDITTSAMAQPASAGYYEKSKKALSSLKFGRAKSAIPKLNSFTFGRSSAARVSKGSYVDTWEGLRIKEPKRHENEHITATIVLYYTCAGGVPTEQDVKAAIDDLEELYQSVGSNGLLSQNKFDFMKSELTVKDVSDIGTKLVTQPPPPKVPAPLDFDVFPS